MSYFRQARLRCHERFSPNTRHDSAARFGLTYRPFCLAYTMFHGAHYKCLFNSLLKVENKVLIARDSSIYLASGCSQSEYINSPRPDELQEDGGDHDGEAGCGH